LPVQEVKLKAAVCYEHGKPLVVEEIDIAPPHQGEVKVRLTATAVCHSDIHLLKGEVPGGLPVVAGHESAGYVEELGEGVSGFSPGDPVAVSTLRSCGRCRFCLTGLSHLCRDNGPTGKEREVFSKKGKHIAQAFSTGTFAEYTVVDRSQIVKLPGDMPMDRAALLACCVITGFGAVVNRAKPGYLNNCAIIGVGGVGLNSIQGAAVSGAYPIIAVDVVDAKLKAARDFGATHTVNSKKVDAVEAVKKLTGGWGTDYVFVTVGNAAAIEQGVAMSAPRGTTVIVGLPNFADTVKFSPFQFIGDERVLTGSFMGTTQLHTEIPRLVELYKAGVLKLDELITGRYPLDKINEAIDEVLAGKALRNVIMFEK
jgi:S-(hydroxymethyl)glutathione dehydrogenase/alcohol dehydrogenase